MDRSINCYKQYVLIINHLKVNKNQYGLVMIKLILSTNCLDRIVIKNKDNLLGQGLYYGEDLNV